MDNNSLSIEVSSDCNVMNAAICLCQDSKIVLLNKWTIAKIQYLRIEDTKKVIRSCNSKKDRQYIVQGQKDKQWSWSTKHYAGN